MEIRLLYENEIQMAVNTAHEVFETCLRSYVRSANEVEQFYRYVCVEKLYQEMHAGRLILWGAFEDGWICGVGAMQNVGHITMLYVRSQYSRRGIGSQLLEHMCMFAARQLNKDRVTINVMPIAAASYFYRRGFSLMQGVPMADCYVSLERRMWTAPQAGYAQPNMGYAQPNMGYAQPNMGYAQPNMGYAQTNMGYAQANAGYAQVNAGYAQKKAKPEVTYTPKKVSTKTTLVLAACVLGISFVMITGVTIHHMATEGLYTEEDHELEDSESRSVREQLPEGMGDPEEI